MIIIFFFLVMTTQCCRCNGHGRCVNWKCVRNNGACTNCTPSKNGHCENDDHQQPTINRKHTTGNQQLSVNRKYTTYNHAPAVLTDRSQSPVDEVTQEETYPFPSSMSNGAPNEPNLSYMQAHQDALNHAWIVEEDGYVTLQ